MRIRRHRTWSCRIRRLKPFIPHLIILLLFSYISKICFIFCFRFIFYLVYRLLQPTHVYINLDKNYSNIKFTITDVFQLNGVAYDFYSLNEIEHNSSIGSQWKIFPLPGESIPATITPWLPDILSKNIVDFDDKYPAMKSTSGLAFVDRIYVVTAAKLADRQANLKRIFDRYQLRDYEWRTKWTRNHCKTFEYKQEIDTKLNLRADYLESIYGQRICPITMEHVDIWHDIIRRNSSLSLVLEDDAVFVPNFAEKFNRTIHTAIRTGALRIGGLSVCTNDDQILLPESTEWIRQDPVLSIGGCLNVYDRAFDKHRTNAPPMLSTHKKRGGRCSHAYLLTACSAQALLRQIRVQINKILESDIFLDVQATASPTLQVFWLDPPIAYQGNQISDLDHIPSFNITTY